MFMSTTALGEWQIRNWTIGNGSEDGPRVRTTRDSAYYNHGQEEKQFMKEQFLAKLPHYAITLL